MRLLLVSLLAIALVVSARAAPAPFNQTRISNLIKDLDSDSFKVREAATRALVQIGPAAVPALRQALANRFGTEGTTRIRHVLQAINPTFEGHSNGWHWVYSDLAQGQTFKAPGATIRKLQLRVARMNRNQPAAALDVEIRSKDLKQVYLRGHIPTADSALEFRWHSVKLDHIADLKPGEEYQMVFHSRGTAAKACWAVNAIYRNYYPHGRANQHATKDFFFRIEFSDGRTLRVGPDGENTTQKLPINSGNEGGAPFGNGTLTLAGVGPLPVGQVMPARAANSPRR